MNRGVPMLGTIEEDAKSRFFLGKLMPVKKSNN
jgi:hypothetical protein